MGKREKTKTNTMLNKKKNKLAGFVMVPEVEPESSSEESLPSVFEIAAPENK